MALFKIYKGNNANLPKGTKSQLASKALSYQEGFAYFTPDTGRFYIDAADERIALSAGNLSFSTVSTANTDGSNLVISIGDDRTRNPSVWVPAATNFISGIVTTGAQTFSGIKTFVNAPSFSEGLATNGNVTGTGSWTAATVGVQYGGTGATTFTSGRALIGNGTGAIQTRAITNNTKATAVTASTNLVTANTLYYHTGNSNIKTVGTITSGTWNGSVVGVAYGGTGVSSITANRLLYGSTSNSVTTIAASNHYINNTAVNIGSTSAPTTGFALGVSGGAVITASSTGNYTDGLRIQPNADDKWGIIYFAAKTSSTTGTHDGGWLVGRMGANGGVGKVNDFTIEHNGSAAGGLTIHKADASISVHGPSVNLSDKAVSLTYNSTKKSLDFVFA